TLVIQVSHQRVERSCGKCTSCQSRPRLRAGEVSRSRLRPVHMNQQRRTWSVTGLTAMLVAWTTLSAAAAVNVQKQGDDFVITTGVYEARVNGKTGLLDQLKIGEVAAVEGMEVGLESRTFERVEVVQQGP